MIGFFRALIRLFHVFGYAALYLSRTLHEEKTQGLSRARVLEHLRHWGKRTLTILGVEFIGELPEPKNNVIILPNHHSYIDIILIQTVYPASIMAKKEVKKWPVISGGSRIVDVVYVDRRNPESRVKAIYDIEKCVKERKSVIVFPEGTTGREPKLKPLKNGMFKLAAEKNIPIVPVAIEYEDQDAAWIDNDTFIRHFFAFFRKKKNRVRFIVGNELRHNNARELKKAYQDYMNSTLSDLRQYWDSGALKN